ncbi:hypothetical protein J2800_003350 [Caulobacter rhizosphaerae]|uniref:Uncharacterized protein n=1 Tax=Caulobacter rhizosphaerae TaxID=2010972 RepID=A0ABU1N2F6_9CAUL|nr:hypothetical protein [Caulobacter rhizosphaerae]MDR6532592.1 hypothetical protein [Caulobacter rhizosphaerae]
MGELQSGPFTRDELDTSVPFIARRCLAGEPGQALLDRVLADLLEWEPPRVRQRKAADLDRLRVAISAILANLIAARRNTVSGEAFVAMSFNRNTYTGTELSSEAVASVRDYLRDQGLVEGQNGYQKRGQKIFGEWNQEHARRTRLRATERLLAQIADAGIDLDAPAWQPASGLGWRKTEDIVRLKDPEPGAGAEPDDVRASRRVLLAVNRLNQSVRLELPRDSWGRILARLHDQGSNEAMDRMSAGDAERVTLYRGFKGGWNNGGRLYGGWWQTLPKSERRHLTIDGKPTVELDYARMHPSLLYAKRDLALDRDPYLPPQFAGPEVREVGKEIFNRLLNGKPGMLRVTAEHKAQLAGAVDFQVLVAAVVDLNRPIADAFGTQAAGWLQRLDSDVLIAVLTRTSKAGVVALPIHDSLIVTVDNEDLLRAAMADGYLEVTGVPAPPICRMASG